MQVMKTLAALCLLSGIAFAGPLHTCSSSNAGTGVSSLTCTIGSVGSNHLIVVIATRPKAVTQSLGDTFFSTSWNVATSGVYSSATFLETMFYQNSGAHSGSDTFTVTWGASSTFTTLYVAEYALNYTYDQNADAVIGWVTASGSHTTDSLTVAVDSELLVAMADCNTSGSNLSLGGSGFTVEGTNANTCVKYADDALGAGTAGTSFSSTWSLSTSNDGIIIMAAFRPIPSPASEPLQTCDASNITKAVASTFSCTLSGVGTHHLVVIFEKYPATATGVSHSDTFGLGGSMAVATSVTWNSSTRVNRTVWVNTGGNSGSDTITLSFSNTNADVSLSVAEYGFNITAVDATATATPGLGSISSGNLTTTRSSELIVTEADCNSYGSAFMTVGSGETREGHDPQGLPACGQWADFTSGAAGTYSGTWTAGTYQGGGLGQNSEVSAVAFLSPVAASVRHRSVLSENYLRNARTCAASFSPLFCEQLVEIP